MDTLDGHPDFMNELVPDMEQTLLPFASPSEEDVYQQRVAAPLDRKIDAAIKLLRNSEPLALRDDPQNGYHLCYSGGKDSDVILELAKMAGVKHRAVYNVTTLDPPELVYYIKGRPEPIHWNRPKHSFFHMLSEIKTNGPPTRLSRWCCEVYKEHGGDGKVKVTGVRGPESPRRKKLWKPIVANKEGTIVCPIVYWTDEDVWEFHRLRGLTHCCLYDEGFSRLGCVGCPLSNNRRKEFARWPGYERQWKRAVQRYWDRLHGQPNRYGKPRWFEKFVDADGLWGWWMREDTTPVDDCQTRLLFTN